MMNVFQEVKALWVYRLICSLIATWPSEMLPQYHFSIVTAGLFPDVSATTTRCLGHWEYEFVPIVCLYILIYAWLMLTESKRCRLEGIIRENSLPLLRLSVSVLRLA